MTSFDEVLAELSRLEREGGALRGGWTLGQVLRHCAQSVEFSLTGFPQQRGWLVRRLVGPLLMRQFLRAGRMSHDLAAAIPGAPELPATSTAEGVERLRRAVAAFRAHWGALAPHFAYGEVGRTDYEALHAMHFADHLTAAAAD